MVCTSRLPSVLPLPQPLTLSHILGKARLREVFKAIGKWSGEERAPLTEGPLMYHSVHSDSFSVGKCCKDILQPVHNMATGRVHSMDKYYTCRVRQNDPFQLGYIRVNLDKGTTAVFSFTG